MMHASIYGRAAFEPRRHTTKTGKDMTTCRVAVDVTGHNAEDQQTLWSDVLAFGKQAEELAKVTKGQMVSAMGRLTKGVYAKPDGTEREQWTLLADSVMTARGGRSKGKSPDRGARMEEVPFDDEIAF